MGLTPQEALDLFNSDDLIGIGMAANEVRRKKTDPRIATYQIDRNINYTNFCTEYCSFCAFYRPLGAKDGYILPLETIYEKIQEMVEMGGTGILLQGGLHPDLRIEFYENMLRSIKRAFSKSSPALLFGAGNQLHRGSFGLVADATRFRGCAMQGSIRFPAAGRKFWTTKFARAFRG